MPELRCGKCGREWEYTGRSDVYCTCPSCKTSVKIQESLLDEDAEHATSQAGEVPETVVLRFGETEVEMGVEEALQELAERVAAAGEAQEGLRERVAGHDDDLADHADQLEEQREATEEVAAVVGELVEGMGGSVNWKHVDTAGAWPSAENGSTVAEVAENLEVE